MVHLKQRLELIRREISLSDALSDEDDILQELTYPEARIHFAAHLLRNKKDILSIVASHLNTRIEDCTLSPVEEWRHGSFNICIPVHVKWKGYARVLFRVPLPYKIGEEKEPGKIDEKVRCEAATYIYIQTTCADVPIPRLWGFGFTDGFNVSLVLFESVPF